ncbi:ankyrin repeat domain-containing protein 17-like isoform X3 [Pocillopora damicornis]|uniref:ankyrin repeat domain-containing protein 17-like isoform X3 n=1 Tax=Pocillopora damicornis TaxID=46731 RepID=UPI000F55103D|nr:ankyrin repeat domain-containing protein 17-like isoform X3 [Pocillopora damicornis]
MWTMSSGDEENDEGIEPGLIDETDPVFRSVAEADVSLDEMMSLACRQGKLDIVELLLESGAHVDYRNKAGNTPLLEACSQGHVDVARYLLDHNANIDAPTETTSDSALTWACTLGNEAIVELLLERTSDVEHRTKDGCTALMFAALAGHVKVAAMLLDHGAKINVESDSNKDSPLTFACWKGHCDVVELLLERNANIEHRTKEGFTPLMFAALGGHTDVARKLLERKAKVNVPSGSNNDIPLTSACWKGHHDVVKLLLEFNSNIEHRTKDGCTPLMLAAREGHYSVAKLILDSNAEVNVPSGSENNIPLTLACWKGHTNVVELLLEHKSNIEHRNKAGCTPLMLASREGHVETTRLLLNKGAEINTPSGSNDDTPLTLACWKGHRDVAELLLENVANRDCRTKTGITPLFQACRENHVDVVELLLDYGASVNAPFPNSRENPLTLAGEKGHVELVSLLLSRNANVECHTKKGCTPFHLACKEGHLEIGVQLLEKGADTEATDSRNNTPLVASMKNGHVEVVEWLLNVVNHLPSEDQCQKCLVAPVDDKEKHDDMMLGRTKCYDLVTKAKKAREQKVQRNTEIFLRELEHEKEKEDIRKKKAAAKRRDKRKRKKAAKDSETLCGVQVGEDLPLENRPQEMADDFDHDQEDNVGDVVDTTREPCSEELLTENNHQEMKTDEKEYLLAQDALKNRQIADDDRNKLKICPSNKRSTLDSGHAKPKRPLSSTGDVSTPQNSLCPHQKGRARSQSAGKETELKNNTLPDKNSRKKSDEPAKITKKKIIPSNSDKADSVKTQKIELKTKTTSEVTQSVTVNCVKPDVKQQIKAEKPSSKKESSEKANSSASSPKKNSYSSKQQNVGNTSSVGDKSSSSKDSSVSGAATTKKSSDATQPFVRRGKDTTNAVDNNSPTTSTVTDGRTSTKGTLAAGHSLSGSNKTTPSEGEREHKPVHSPRSKQQHSQLGRGEDNWKEVTRSTNSKTVMYQLTAPNAICGRVIGRGGSKINSITEESGAQITIGKPEPKNPTDRVITIKGSNKAVQRAKFLVTQALNTPSTIGQTTSSVSTATTSNAMSSSDRTQTSTSPAPVRGNYAAIPSSSSSSEWPTIEQANNMAVQAPAAKPTAPNRNDKPSEGTKSSPELSDGSQEVFEDAVVASADVVVSGTETSSIFATSTPVVADSTQTTSSAWKPYRQSSPQSMGACTSAVTTSGSSSMTVASSQEPIGRLMIEKHNGDVPAPHRPFHLQGTSCVQAQAQLRNNRLSDMQGLDPVTLHESWEQKVSSSSTSTSVATVSISTSAVTTANHRDHHITPENPFGVIGEVSVATSAYQTEAAVPDFNSQQESLLQNRVSSSSGDATTSGLLQSPRERNKSKLPSYFSSWASQSSGFSDISSDSITTGRKLEGPLPGMNIFTSSLFSTGSLSSYPWSTGEDSREHEERARSISWSGQQHDYQGEHQFISPVKEKFSPSSQKSGSDAAAVNLRASDLRGDSGTFKSLSSGIWGPVSSQPPHAASLSVVCDDSTPDKQAWNNSDSTSSSRSSSRQELSSIMDSDLPPSNNVWNSSALLEDMTPTPQEAQGGINTALSDQGVPTGSQWVPGRGAYSAPSSPSLPRAHNLPESAPPSMGGRPSVDDFAVRSWNSKRRSPRSLSSSEPSTAWNENLPAQPRRSSVDLSQPGGGENSIPAHPWQQYSRLPQGYPPGLTMRENWREQQGPVGNSEINQLLQRLSLEKYVPLFEEHGIDATRLSQMVEEDLENLGIPKGPRLKLLHGARWCSGNNFQTPGNGFVKTDPPPAIITSNKKPSKMEPQPMFNNHNHILPHHSDTHLSPLGHKKQQQSLKQTLHPSVLQTASNHGNQHLLSLMTSPGRGLNPAQHIGMGSHNHASGHTHAGSHASNLPPRPHSASGSMTTSQGYAPVVSHGDQALPGGYVPQQGQFVNHMPYTQAPQVFYPGGFYYFYPQQQ